jgi:hypothetical protein
MHEEMFSILGQKGNENQNDIDISSNSSKDGYHQKQKQQQMLARIWGEKKPFSLLVGM